MIPPDPSPTNPRELPPIVWTEYVFPCPFAKQKELVARLKPLVEELERAGLLLGFSFNHFYSEGPEGRDRLAVRFSTREGEDKGSARERLFSAFGTRGEELDRTRTPAEWRRAYEMGSRWAFLFMELAARGRADASLLRHPEARAWMVHGLLNSLGVSTVPEETGIHYFLFKLFSRKLGADLAPYLKELDDAPGPRPEALWSAAERLSREERIAWPAAEGPDRRLWALVLLGTAWAARRARKTGGPGDPVQSLLAPALLDALDQGGAR